jgi:EpsI family protein
VTNRIALICIILVATFGVRTWLSAAPKVASHRPLSEFPQQLGDYQMIASQSVDSDVQAVLKADDSMIRWYQASDGKRAEIFVAYYAVQKAGESMHSPKNCLPGSGWQPTLNDRVTVNGPNGPVEVNRYIVEKGGDRSLILYWYHSGNRIYASEYWGKAYLIADSARTGQRDGAIARIVMALPKNASVDAVSQEAAKLAGTLQTAVRPFVGAN